MLRTAGDCVTSLSSTFLFSPSPVRTKLLIFHGLCTRFPRIVHAVAPFCASYGGRGTCVRRPSSDACGGRRTRVPRPPQHNPCGIKAGTVKNKSCNRKGQNQQSQGIKADFPASKLSVTTKETGPESLGTALEARRHL